MATTLAVAARGAFGTGLLAAFWAGTAIFDAGLGAADRAAGAAATAATAATALLAFAAGAAFAAGLVPAGGGGFGGAAEDALEPADEAAGFFGCGFRGGAGGLSLGGNGCGRGGGAATIATTVTTAFATFAPATLALTLSLAATTAIAAAFARAGELAFGATLDGAQGLDFTRHDGLAFDAENRAITAGGSRSGSGGGAGGFPSGGRAGRGGREDIEPGLGSGSDGLDGGGGLTDRSRRGGGLGGGLGGGGRRDGDRGGRGHGSGGRGFGGLRDGSGRRLERIHVFGRGNDHLDGGRLVAGDSAVAGVGGVAGGAGGAFATGQPGAAAGTEAVDGDGGGGRGGSRDGRLGRRGVGRVVCGHVFVLFWLRRAHHKSAGAARGDRGGGAREALSRGHNLPQRHGAWRAAQPFVCSEKNRQGVGLAKPRAASHGAPLPITMDKLEEIFRMQEALNARIGVTLPPPSDEEKAKWILNYTRAMQQETAELIDSVPWKWWAKYQKFDEQNAKVEVVDLFHFLVSLAQTLGMSAEDVYQAYLKKNQVNHQRQETGYVKKDAEDSRHI